MSNESVGWQTYEDSKYGYKIQYPQEWKFVKGLFSISTDFSVSPDSEDVSAVETLANVHVNNESKTLNPTTLQVESIPLKQYADAEIQEMTSIKGTPNVLKNEGITFNGQPAWRLEYIHNYLGAQLSYNIHIFVAKDGRLYDISYTTPPLKVPEMRPIGEKIIQTFQFTNNTKLS